MILPLCQGAASVEVSPQRVDQVVLVGRQLVSLERAKHHRVLRECNVSKERARVTAYSHTS